MKHTLLTACAALGALFALHTPATADPGTTDVTQQIHALRATATRADLYLIVSKFDTLYDLGLIDVIRTGCHYRTANQADTASLLDVVAHADLHPTPADTKGIDLRVVLHIYTDDTHYMSLAMSQDFDDNPVNGKYFGPDTGMVADIPTTAPSIEAPHGLQNALHAWATEHPALAIKPCHP